MGFAVYSVLMRKIAPDKWKHFWVGIPMGAVLQAAMMFLFPGQQLLAGLLAMAAVVGISYGFELFSLITGWGHYDFWDAVASIIGGTIGVAVIVGIF